MLIHLLTWNIESGDYMSELTQKEYLRKLAPDFSVLEMLEQAYYQGQTEKLNDLGKGIFYYYLENKPENKPENENNIPVLYRAMFLFDEPEDNENKYFKNKNYFVYEVYPFGDRYVAIAVLIDRLFKKSSDTNNSLLLPTTGIEVNLPTNDTDINKKKFSNVFGVGF